MKSLIYVKKWVSPCGDLYLGACGRSLCLCDWDFEKNYRNFVKNRLIRNLNAIFLFDDDPEGIQNRAISMLKCYFNGVTTRFDLPLLLAGTDFQKAVWNAICNVGYGETLSYLDIAKAIGMPSAVRAVAGACRANATSIFVPCHRIIAANGELTGYAGGIEAKKILLNLEKSKRFGS